MSDPAEASAAAGFRVDPADEADVQAGLRDVAGGRSVALSESELAEWCETGELPRSVEQRVNELECAASRS